MTRENHPVLQSVSQGPWPGGVKLLAWNSWWCGRKVSYLAFPLSLLRLRSGGSAGWHRMSALQTLPAALIPDIIFPSPGPVPKSSHYQKSYFDICPECLLFFCISQTRRQICQEPCHAYQAALHPHTICRWYGVGGASSPPRCSACQPR